MESPTIPAPTTATRPGTQASLEWPGKRCADGSMATAALLTAVAASPKPTAMRRTLPGYSVMSPAAKTRSHVGAHRGVDHDVPLVELQPPRRSGAEVGDEAECGDHRLGRTA